jgi:hypothetical protein
MNNHAGGYGGAMTIDRAGIVTITASTFTRNDIGGGDGGAIDLEEQGGALKIAGSKFIGNGAFYAGGAVLIYNGNNNSVAISKSIFANNNSDGCGGALCLGSNLPVGAVTLSGVILRGNDSSTGNGGGALVNGSTLTVTKSVITHNSATDGGGLYVDSALIMTSSTVRFNTAGTNGGGVFFSAGKISLSCFEANGVGVYDLNGSSSPTDSVVTGNWWGAIDGPGGPDGPGSGDGYDAGSGSPYTTLTWLKAPPALPPCAAVLIP